MSDVRHIVARAPFNRLAWPWRTRLARMLRAWRYARGKLTADDAQDIIVECERDAGWYPLLILSVGDALESALDDYRDHPKLRSYIASACEHVHRKWEGNSDERYAALEWTTRLATEWAAEDGVAFMPIETADDEEPAPDQARA